MPEGTKFLEPSPYNTLTIPSTAMRVVTVAYYSNITGGIQAESGKGFNANYLINPDIATVGTNILTIDLDGNNVISTTGSSAATAIVAGVCALLLQWAVTDKNDLAINSTKIRSLLIYAAKWKGNFIYPNEENGYGDMDLDEVFNIIAGNYRISDNEYDEYHINNLFVRIPKQ